MNLPTDFPELDVLLKKMNARTEPEIDMRMRVIGIDVTQDNFDFKDEIPLVKNRKVALFLPDVWKFRKAFNTDPKYHVLHCDVVQRMKTRGTYTNLSATRRSDGKFPVKLSNGNELSLIKLTICEPCLGQLNSKYPGVFPVIPTNFPLEDWFEPFFDYSSAVWKARSQSCREKANWTCQNRNCKINLESDPHLLHAHHKWGKHYNDPDDLIALCIGCHSKQDGDGHKMLKYYPDYNEFMTKYGEQWNAYHQPF